MDDRNLDHLLAQHREATLPPLSATFQQGVWREIRQRKAESGERRVRWFGWLLEPLFRPPMAFAALSLALVLGVGVGLGTTSQADSRNARTRLALDLEVFGSSSPALPATLIASSR